MQTPTLYSFLMMGALSLGAASAAAPPAAPAGAAAPAPAPAAPSAPAAAPAATASPPPPPVIRAGPPVRVVEVPEPGSGQRFPSPQVYQGRNYPLIGVGLLKEGKDAKDTKTSEVKHYAMGLYVEDVARQSFQSMWDKSGRRRAGMFVDSRAQNFFTWGHFGKLAVLRFLRATSKAELQAPFQKGLAELMTEKHPAELRKAAQSFIELFDTDLKDGDEVKIHTDDGGRIEVELLGQKKPGPNSPKLARAIWELWMGYHSVSKEMRQSLVGRMDVLSK